MIFPCQCPFFIGSASHGGPSALWISDDFSQMAASLKDGLLVVGVILPGILTADRRLVIWSFFCAKQPWNFSWFSRGKKTESWLFVNVHDPILDGMKISFDMFCRILKRWSWHCWDFPLDEKVRFSWPASMQSCPPSLCKKSSNVLRKPWFLHQKSIANDFTDFECIKK